MRQQLTPYKKVLAVRDGQECFFCGIKSTTSKLTIEHLLSIHDGGSDNMQNLCLACHYCNQKVGRMSVVKKIKYREEMRSNV